MAEGSTLLADMITACERTGGSVIALKQFGPDQISSYGVIEPAGPPTVRGLRPHLRHGREAGRRRRTERPGHHGPLRADAGRVRPDRRPPARRRRGAAADRRHARPLPDRARSTGWSSTADASTPATSWTGCGPRSRWRCSTRSWARASATSWPRSSAGRASAEPRRAGRTAADPRPTAAVPAARPAPKGPILGRRRYPPQRDPPRRRPAGGPGGLPAVAGGDGQPARLRSAT